jgi:hypothetical protein
MKLTIDQQLQLSILLTHLADHDFGDLPGFQSGEWSRKNLESLTRDIARKPLPDLRT